MWVIAAASIIQCYMNYRPAVKLSAETIPVRKIDTSSILRTNMLGAIIMIALALDILFIIWELLN